jgi:hypothetical protein
MKILRPIPKICGTCSHWELGHCLIWERPSESFGSCKRWKQAQDEEDYDFPLPPPPKSVKRRP